MVVPNPLGVNGPRQRKTTGRLRNALTNIASKQNPFPEYVIQRLPYTPNTPKPAVRLLPAPPKTDPAKLVEQLRARAQVSVPEEEPLPTPKLAPATPGLSVAQAISSAMLMTAALAQQQRGLRQLPQGGTPQANMALGKTMAAQLYGWTGEQWQALRELWMRESGWRHTAVNQSSGAVGIPQRLPSAQPFKSPIQREKWLSDPRLQILWGLRYIAERYGNPVAALRHSDQYGWY